MTLLSYISIPYTSSSNEISYLRIDLTTNKVFIKGNEVFNFDELKDDVTEDTFDDHDSNCLDCDHKNDLIELIKAELEKETKKEDNEDYVKELKETLEKMQM